MRVSRKVSIRSVVLPKSAMLVIVVTGVSAVTLTLVVFSFTVVALMVSVDLYDMKAGFVCVLIWCFVWSVSSVVHSRAVRVLLMAVQTVSSG